MPGHAKLTCYFFPCRYAISTLLQQIGCDSIQLIRSESALPNFIFPNTHICECRNDFEFLEYWMSTFGS